MTNNLEEKDPLEEVQDLQTVLSNKRDECVARNLVVKEKMCRDGICRLAQAEVEIRHEYEAKRFAELNGASAQDIAVRQQTAELLRTMAKRAICLDLILEPDQDPDETAAQAEEEHLQEPIATEATNENTIDSAGSKQTTESQTSPVYQPYEPPKPPVCQCKPANNSWHVKHAEPNERQGNCRHSIGTMPKPELCPNGCCVKKEQRKKSRPCSCKQMCRGHPADYEKGQRSPTSNTHGRNRKKSPDYDSDEEKYRMSARPKKSEGRRDSDLVDLAESSAMKKQQQKGTKNLCPFCYEENEKFIKKSSLNAHFRERCPMMIECQFCNRIIEVRNIDSHRLNSCAWLKDQMKPCQICGQSCSKEELRKHEKGKDCPGRLASEGEAWCSLCDRGVENTSAGWRRHLIGPRACSGSDRRDLFGVPSRKHKDDH